MYIDNMGFSHEDRTQSYATNTRTVATLNESGMIATTFIPFPPSVVEASNKETHMHVDIEDTDELSFAKDHLLDRLSTVRSEYDASLRKHFHMDDDDAPDTAEAYVKRIQAGKFVFSDEKNKANPDHYSRYWPAYNFIRWRDPEVKADATAYNAARAKLQTSYESHKDDIIVLPEADALRSFNEFKGREHKHFH